MFEIKEGYEIKESNDYKALTQFFYENGLEITPRIERPDKVIKCWECKDSVNYKLIAGAALETRDGQFVVADLAVDKEYRNENIGKRLMEIMEAEIISLGGTEAWLVGKVPEYYYKLGWEAIAWEKAPAISNCFTCAKFEKECNPKVMYKSL